MFSVISFIMRVLEFSFLFLLLIYFFFQSRRFYVIYPGRKSWVPGAVILHRKWKKHKAEGVTGPSHICLQSGSSPGWNWKSWRFSQGTQLEGSSSCLDSITGASRCRLRAGGSVGGYECAAGLDQGWEASCAQLRYNPFPLCVAK